MTEGAKLLIYLDANALITATEKRQDAIHGRIAAMLMDLIADANPERVKFLSSELTLAEVMVKPLQARDDSLVETYKGLLFRSEAVSLVPVSLTILMQAAVLRSRYPQLKLPDAIHLATAQTGSASQFVTDDRQLLAAVERTGTILSVPFDVVKPSALIAIARA